MVDPISIFLASIGAIINIGSSLMQADAQNKQSKANKHEAQRALSEVYKDIDLRADQETEAAQRTIFQIDREARSADALARVSAGEAGVAGASVDALLSDLERDRLDAKSSVERNTKMTLAQLEREKVGAETVARNRANSVPEANPFVVGLQIAGNVLDAGTNLIGQLPKRK